MAKRPTARSKVASRASSTAALSNLRSDYLSSSSSSLGNTKKDKRLIRHGQLLARVQEGGINKEGRKSRETVRRPGKKLKTAEGLLKDLSDALPDVDMDNTQGTGGETTGVYAEDEWEGVSDSGNEGDVQPTDVVGKKRRRRKVAAGGSDGKMVMKSLSHRQGSMKRKKVLEEREMERFKKNLAQLAQAESGSGEVGGEEGKENNESHKQRWAALRAFIGTTMEKDKAFGG